MSEVEVTNLSFEPKKILRVSGIPKPDAKSFSINIGHSKTEIGLHIAVRFNTGVTVMNSMKDGKWLEEEKDNEVHLKKGEAFEVIVTMKDDLFTILFSDAQTLTFPNLLGDKKYNFLCFWGDVIVHGVNVK